MSPQQERIVNFYELFRRLFTFVLQSNPRYFQVFLHREIGPRYLSLPRIGFCTLGILLAAPLARIFFPPLTFVPLYLLPFAPHPVVPGFRDGNFTVHATELLPFVVLAIAFVITAVRRHLDGERRIINGERLHSYYQGVSRLFDQNTSAVALKEPLLIFGLGAVYAYLALFTGAFHPAFGSFLMVGAIDYAIAYALIARYWNVRVQDQLDEEIGAANFQKRREEALGGHDDEFGGEDPADFNRDGPRAAR
jgi:hypothetical protein